MSLKYFKEVQDRHGAGAMGDDYEANVSGTERNYLIIVANGATEWSNIPGYSILTQEGDFLAGDGEDIDVPAHKKDIVPMFKNFRKDLYQHCSDLPAKILDDLVKEQIRIVEKAYYEADEKIKPIVIKDERELEFYVDGYDNHANFYIVRPDRKFIKLTIDYISLAKRNGKLEVYKPDIHDYFASSKRVDIDRSIVASPNGFKSLIVERVNNEDSWYGRTFDEYNYASKAVKVDYKKFYEGALNASRFTEQQIKTIESEKEEVRDQIAYLQRYLEGLEAMC